MGYINEDVRIHHLNAHSEEEKFLKAFLSCFYVTWGRIRKAYNSELSLYFLSPEPFLSESYGFEQEIMLVYSKYPELEARTFQAAEAFINDDPAKNRVERLSYFLVSESPNVQEWIDEYTFLNQESRLIIPFYAKDLRDNWHEDWFVRNIISNYLYTRDLFNYKLPLEKDTYFFGRSDIVKSLLDSIKRFENRGIFGLRKTGKTSLLFKIERILNSEGGFKVVYIDCKSPSIRKLRWNELLKETTTQLNSNIKKQFTETNSARMFSYAIERSDKPIVFMFDEIEYISPYAMDSHWSADFIDFWQTIWSCQSRLRKFSIIISGVNPSVVEIDTFNKVQNPLFGLVSTQYLTGLSESDTRNMLRTLGKRMGMKFDYKSLSYIFNRYGGHPLLTRMACSILNSIYISNNVQRPIPITDTDLVRSEEERDSELIFYCRHVVTELKQFYSDEYEMLELLASGRTYDFLELAQQPEYIQHLTSYGLIKKDQNKMPYITIPVVGRFVALELARSENRQTLLKLIPIELRESWLKKRVSSIISNFRDLEKLIKRDRKPSLFGPNSFSRAEEFCSIPVVSSVNDFRAFINVSNLCFVESVENYGRSIGDDRYYWTTIKQSYGGLWDSLHRIKVYRHNEDHLNLTDIVDEQLSDYLKKDLENKPPSSVDDLYYILQQCVMDGLLTGLQIEIYKFI